MKHASITMCAGALATLVACTHAYADDCVCGTLESATNGQDGMIALREGESVNFWRGGTVRHGATPIVFGEPRDSHRAGIRVIHQEPEIVPNLTVAENIFVGELPRLAGVLLDWRKLEEQTDRVLATFGMQQDMRPRQLCGTLGPARRQMIEIMRAIRAGGRLIAFD